MERGKARRDEEDHELIRRGGMHPGMRLSGPVLRRPQFSPGGSMKGKNSTGRIISDPCRSSQVFPQGLSLKSQPFLFYQSRPLPVSQGKVHLVRRGPRGNHHDDDLMASLLQAGIRNRRRRALLRSREISERKWHQYDGARFIHHRPRCPSPETLARSPSASPTVRVCQQGGPGGIPIPRGSVPCRPGV